MLAVAGITLKCRHIPHDGAVHLQASAGGMNTEGEEKNDQVQRRKTNKQTKKQMEGVKEGRRLDRMRKQVGWKLGAMGG